jgi:hypothetical protein
MDKTSMSELRVTSSRFDSPVAPAAEIYSRIRASVDGTPASSSRTHTRIAASVAAVPCLTGVAVIVASEIVYGRQGVGLDFGVHSTSQMLLVLFSLIALTFLTTFAAVRQGKHGLGSGVLALMMIVGLAMPIYAALTVVDPVHDNGLLGPSGLVLSPWGYRCLTLAATVGVVVLASFTMALRRSAPVASRLRGAALGAAAGVWAGVGVFIFCPSGHEQHLLVGHVLPILAFTLLGAIATPRALRP